MQQAEAVPRTAVLFLTHFVNSAILDRYRRLRRSLAGRHDVFLSVHLAEPRLARRLTRDLAGPRLFCFTTEMLQRLPYARARGPWATLSPVPGRVDLCLQLFRLLHPDYERVYLVEHDVVYGGDWATLFAALDASPADLLATNIFREDEHPGWANWAGLRIDPLPPHRRVAAFQPFCRLSRAALLAVDAVYRQGWTGHCEALIPTALLAAGLSVEDIGGEGSFVPPGHERRYYWSDLRGGSEIYEGCFVYRPLQQPSGERAWLWHPVKIDPRRDGRYRLRRILFGRFSLQRFLAKDPRYRRLDTLLPPLDG